MHDISEWSWTAAPSLVACGAAMKIAWGMYEGMGFERAPDLDFMPEQLPVFGFRLRL